jgi:hypothetical protein
MKKSNYMIWLAITTAAGTAAGILSNQRHPEKGGLIGAVMGAFAGTVAAELYKCITEEDGISYYTKSSPLYENFNDIEYI